MIRQVCETNDYKVNMCSIYITFYIGILLEKSYIKLNIFIIYMLKIIQDKGQRSEPTNEKPARHVWSINNEGSGRFLLTERWSDFYNRWTDLVFARQKKERMLEIRFLQ